MIELFIGIALWVGLGSLAALAVGRASAIGAPHRVPSPTPPLRRG